MKSIAAMIRRHDFLHSEQSLRVVDVLEQDGRGLNLTWEVRDGIVHHSKGAANWPLRRAGGRHAGRPTCRLVRSHGL